MNQKIDHAGSRENLKPRREPYWQRVNAGCYVGFRKMAADSKGAWVARSRSEDTGKQAHRALGEFAHLPAHQQYDAAKKAAHVWFEHLGKGGTTEIVTVSTACENYVKRAREDGQADKAYDLNSRFSRWVYPDKFANIELAKLTRKHVDAWRRKIAATPVVINPHADEKKTRPRSPSSLNRDMTALRAALNFAHDEAHVTNDMAWRVALRPIENADGRRDAYLDRAQRVALIAKSPPDIALFLTAMSLVPLRPGALACLKVSHFDKRLGVLTIGKDKAGRDRKIKLPPKTAEFFTERAKTNRRPPHCSSERMERTGTATHGKSLSRPL